MFTVSHPEPGRPDVQIEFYDDGPVMWMSDWSAAARLVEAGVLRRGPVHRNCHGHQDLYLANGGDR